MNVVRHHFRPEFLNRVDEILLFHRLKRSEMTRIVDIQLDRLKKLLADRKITIQLDDKAREWLGDKGYDPAYGARPLKRVIQKYVQDPLAEQVLAGKIHDGETVKISAGKDGLVIQRRDGEPAERSALEDARCSELLEDSAKALIFPRQLESLASFPLEGGASSKLRFSRCGKRVPAYN